jgi:D-inositol-3-phosphate glycosyltransferase
MKKKVAFISEHASPLALLGGVDSGGQNVYVDQVARQLAIQGYDVDVFTRWDDPSHKQIVEYAPGIRVVNISAGPQKQIPKENIFQFMDEFASEMIGFIENNKISYELVHAHFWMSGYVAALIKNILNIPFVITFHALGKVRRLHQGSADGFPESRSRIEEMIVKEADAIIAECPQDKEDLMVLYFAEEEKIKIIPCGFDRSEFYPMNSRKAKMSLGLDPSERIVLQLGRMVPRKGVDNVIRSIASLLDIKNIPIRLIIVGGEYDDMNSNTTPEVGRLRKIAKEENILDKVTFVGRKNRDQLKLYYNAAEVFVSTPWYEPFGITPLEAMACGTPVIGSNVGGIKYSVSHGNTGFLVPPNEPEILARRILEIVDNSSLYRTLSLKAISHVNKFFTWEKVSGDMISLYEMVRRKEFDMKKKIGLSFKELVFSWMPKKTQQLT